MSSKKSRGLATSSRAAYARSRRGSTDAKGNGDIIKALIVGIDPGTNTGVAILDLNGSLLHFSSRRDESRSETIREVMRHGDPFIIAVDVHPAPKTVEKIASSLGALMWVPRRSMTNAEKSKTIKAFKKEYRKATAGRELKLEDKHEKDALAAALRAFKTNRTFFIKVRDALRKHHAEPLLDEIVPMLMKDESENIANAVRAISKRKK
ncbi:MAG: DUF460 domain-containing protein [Candidatus Aenigmatarchaeota archaeon]